jgi:hypothetical protein
MGSSVRKFRIGGKCQSARGRNCGTLVDYTGRLFRDGKAALSRELSGILERLGSSALSWRARLEKLARGRLFGRFFAASRERRREVARGLLTAQKPKNVEVDVVRGQLRRVSLRWGEGQPIAGDEVMRKTSRYRVRILWFCVPCALMLGIRSHAQDPPFAFDQVVGQPRGLPQLPPQGAWGEVINVTTRWIVIQNHSGQQFPIAVDDIGEFLVRWPSGVDRLGTQSVVEAIGPDLGSNMVEVSHIDVFEGADRTLVSPTYNSLLPNNVLVTAIDPGFNRMMSPWDYAGQSMLYGWAYPVAPGIEGIPARLHVVGTVIQRVPLQLSVLGNNIATVVAGRNVQFSVSQVTRGQIAYVRKGDYAFLLPLQINPKGLAVSQLVLYKSIPFRQFNPAVK